MNCLKNYICQKPQAAQMEGAQCIAAPKKKGKESQLECDLRCEKKIDFPEYIGPVHYSMMIPPFELYNVTLIETALINMVYFLIGSTVMIVLFHTLAFRHYWPLNFHILLITIGSQVFIPVAFMLQHPLDGAAIWMTCKDRHSECFIMRLAGIGCIWFPTILLTFFGEYRKISFHSFFGYASALTCIGDVIMLYFVHFQGALLKFDRFICVPSFLFSTLAFISGIFRSGMKQWYPSPHIQIPIFMTIFCLVYTILIVFRPIKSFINNALGYNI